MNTNLSTVELQKLEGRSEGTERLVWARPSLRKLDASEAETGGNTDHDFASFLS